MKPFIFSFLIVFMLFFISCSDSDTNNNNNNTDTQQCSVENPTGKCSDSSRICDNGYCVPKSSICNPLCENNQFCFEGKCFDLAKEVDCNENTPENAELINDPKEKVVVKWNTETNEWSKPIDCIWSCKQGYEYDENSEKCLDVDECTNGMANCSENAVCNNTSGSFECVCKSGYEGDGILCSVIAACENNPCTESHKTVCKDENNDGIAECLCDAGYKDNNGSCEDINECDDENLNNCDSNATCVNTEGSFECNCNEGYTGDGITCEDVNSIKFITFNIALGAHRCYDDNPVIKEDSCPTDCNVDCSTSERYCVKQLLKTESSVQKIAEYLHAQFDDNEKGIIFLQEVNTSIGANILEVIKNEFGGEWDYTFFSPIGNTYGIAIVSNILHTKEQFWQLPVPTSGQEARGAIALKMKLNNKFVWVVNAHLGLKETDQIEQAEEIKSKYLTFTSTANVVIAGDFNILDIYNHGDSVPINSDDIVQYGKTIQVLLDSGIKKLSFKDSENRKYSFHSWNSISKGRNIDYIFWLNRNGEGAPEISTLRPKVTDEITSENSLCPGNGTSRYLSDHNGLMFKYNIFE